ncbi:unnamed protein product [Penicillium salamii]|nr:unnamed protein product [Penicillium salamii]
MTARPTKPASDHPQLKINNDRKRVSKACDRCRMKKSKCNGSSPCSRCRADNTICVFGGTRKSSDKVYPKGYVEALEKQQIQLVQGLQTLYKRIVQHRDCPGERLKLDPNGHPPIRDLLMSLGTLENTKGEQFQETSETLRQHSWRNNSELKGQHPTESTPDSPQFPVTHSRLLSEDYFEHILPPTSSTCNPSTMGPVEIGPETPNIPQLANSMPVQCVVDPFVLCGSQQWINIPLSPVSDTNLKSTTDVFNICSVDQQPTSFTTDCQPLMNLGSEESYWGLEYKYQDVEDFNKLFNSIPTEITSV